MIQFTFRFRQRPYGRCHVNGGIQGQRPEAKTEKAAMMETTMFRTGVGWRGDQGASRINRAPKSLECRSRTERRSEMEMEKVYGIVTSGVSVWLAIVAGMTALQ